MTDHPERQPTIVPSTGQKRKIDSRDAGAPFTSYSRSTPVAVLPCRALKTARLEAEGSGTIVKPEPVDRPSPVNEGQAILATLQGLLQTAQAESSRLSTLTSQAVESTNAIQTLSTDVQKTSRESLEELQKIKAAASTAENHAMACQGYANAAQQSAKTAQGEATQAKNLLAEIQKNAKGQLKDCERAKIAATEAETHAEGCQAHADSAQRVATTARNDAKHASESLAKVNSSLSTAQTSAWAAQSSATSAQMSTNAAAASATAASLSASAATSSASTAKPSAASAKKSENTSAIHLADVTKYLGQIQTSAETAAEGECRANEARMHEETARKADRVNTLIQSTPEGIPDPASPDQEASHLALQSLALDFARQAQVFFQQSSSSQSVTTGIEAPAPNVSIQTRSPADTPDEELVQLRRDFIGTRKTIASDHIPLLRLLGTIKQKVPSFTMTFPLSRSFVDTVPLLEDEVDQPDQYIRDGLDAAWEDGYRSRVEKAKIAGKMFLGGQERVKELSFEQKRVVWGWWLEKLLAISLEKELDKDLWDCIRDMVFRKSQLSQRKGKK